MHLLYLVNQKKVLIPALLLLSLFVFTQTASAEITNASNTITTSRPSPSTPLSSNAAASSTTISVFNNGSRFLASDSAKIRQAVGIDSNVGLTVSSQSADLTNVYLGTSTSAFAGAGADVLYFPVTAMHAIQFTIGTEIPDEGDVEIVFPALTSGDADNDASPSATTFQFNNLVPGGSETDPTNISVWSSASNDITANVTVTETEPTAGSGGRISVEFDSGPIAAGTTITIFLGCSTAGSQTSCTTQVPRIINPTKTAAAGTADSWKVQLTTEDASDVELESVTLGIGTNESVTVRATVDPTLTFTISGIDSGDDLAEGNIGCATSGSYGQLANSGINSTANNVNLGILQNTPAAGGSLANLAGQLIEVSTNGPSGYSLTATSSSSLLNESTGYFFRTSETPTNFAAADDFFGLHPCGNDVDNTWVEGSPGGGSDCTFVSGADGGTADECLWAWPNDSNTLSGGITLTLASDSSGPVGSGTGENGDGYTSIAYGAGIDVNVPPGEYRTIITYIATPTF